MDALSNGRDSDSADGPKIADSRSSLVLFGRDTPYTQLCQRRLNLDPPSEGSGVNPMGWTVVRREPNQIARETMPARKLMQTRPADEKFFGKLTLESERELRCRAMAYPPIAHSPVQFVPAWLSSFRSSLQFCTGGNSVAPPKKQDSVVPHRKSDRPTRSRGAWRVCAAT